jgi:hypothetical protein
MNATAMNDESGGLIGSRKEFSSRSSLAEGFMRSFGYFKDGRPNRFAKQFLE